MKRHSMTDSVYLKDPKRIENAIGPAAKELNLTNEDYPDGVDTRWKVIKPEIKVQNYTSDIQPDSRRICATCKHGGEPQPTTSNIYRIWCKEAFVRGVPGWKTEPKTLTDRSCRDWLPRSIDCVG